MIGKRRFAATTSNPRYDNRSVSAHVRGWDNGIRVETYVNSADQEVFVISKTHGSNHPSNVHEIATMVDGVVTSA